MRLFVLGFAYVLLLSCSQENSKDINLDKQFGLQMNLKFAKEDSKALATLLSSRAKNFNEVKSTLERNNIEFEYEVLEGAKYNPILLNNYRILFSKDGHITNVDLIK